MTQKDYDEFLKSLSDKFPKFKLIAKNKSFLMKLISFLLKVITFGKMNNFMDSFYTTVGYTVYYPESYKESTFERRFLILLHESVHMAQMREERLWGVEFIGMMIYAIKYLFLPVPLFRAKSRMKYELEAYATDIVMSNKLFGTELFGRRKDFVVATLSGPQYFWTWTDKKDLEKRLVDEINKIHSAL